MTRGEYGQDLEARLSDLHGRIHRGAYRAQPSRRIRIPKADGRKRPIGIAALEDKIAQHAVGTVLNQIWEEDFKGFSYGFRPGRGQFGLELHPEKTRLIEFGRYAAERRKKRGEGKSETFAFPGFTPICGTNHTTGNCTVDRKTIGKRMV